MKKVLPQLKEFYTVLSSGEREKVSCSKTQSLGIKVWLN